jgi:hypothetical protein
MNDRPTADLEARLAAAFGRRELPHAPVTLYRRLELVVELEPRVRERRSRRRILVWVARLVTLGLALLALLGVIVLSSGAGAPGPGPSDARSPDATSVDGLPVRIVSDVLALRAAGDLRKEPVAVGGFWTNRSRGHSCAAPDASPGELELYCHDGQYGITERDEPILRFVDASRAQPATGPHLTPYLEPSVTTRNLAFAVSFQIESPPVPIVVVGHFDDPRAADCRAGARQLCRDRLVVDRVASYDPADLARVTPPLAAAEFGGPVAPPPPFDQAACPEIAEHVFAGWTLPAAIGLPDERGVVWAIVSSDARVVADWADDPGGSGHRVRLLGNWMCAARESDPTAIMRGPVPTTLYLEWDDGRLMLIGPNADL